MKTLGKMIYLETAGKWDSKARDTILIRLASRVRLIELSGTVGISKTPPPLCIPPPHTNNSMSINNPASHLEGARQDTAIPAGRKLAMSDLFESDHQANGPEREVNYERQRVLGE